MKEYKCDISRVDWENMEKDESQKIIALSSDQFASYFGYTINEGEYKVWYDLRETKNGDDIAVLQFFNESSNKNDDLKPFEEVIYFKFLEAIEHIEIILTELINLDPELKQFFDEIEESETEIEEDEKTYTVTLSNGVSLDLDKSDMYNFRIFDPTHLVSQKYTYPDGYTEWSRGSYPYEEVCEDEDEEE